MTRKSRKKYCVDGNPPVTFRIPTFCIIGLDLMAKAWGEPRDTVLTAILVEAAVKNTGRKAFTEYHKATKALFKEKLAATARLIRAVDKLRKKRAR